LIFVSVGSREYQFNRLLKKLDELVKCGAITDTVIAQIGQSSYIPKYYRYKRFMPVDEFKVYQCNADLIISHGGTGSLISALKMGTQVLAVPRLMKYGEHIDDHQTQVVEVLAKEGYLRYVIDMDNLLDEINTFKSEPITKVYNKPSRVINVIEDYLTKSF
jgi:UDP-N-acetylglucosamine transferase subunit ALG13